MELPSKPKNGRKFLLWVVLGMVVSFAIAYSVPGTKCCPNWTKMITWGFPAFAALSVGSILSSSLKRLMVHKPAKSAMPVHDLRRLREATNALKKLTGCSTLQLQFRQRDITMLSKKVEEECINRVFSLEQLRQYIQPASRITIQMYSHLQTGGKITFIAIYTTLFLYLDNEPNSVFIRGEVHDSEILNHLAALLRDVHLIWNRLSTELIITSTLSFITSLLIARETQGISMMPPAKAYCTYTRQLSSISNVYSIFVFPRALPASDWIQALPQVTKLTSHMKYVDISFDLSNP
ncbi:hypothetical protein BDZ97DRAFT_1755371 [Flammula alnicola]|nr:hypothetical protein BDZ97DRAFT_1755371 [Flammula alnicola]